MPAQWWDRQELDAVWNGVALVLHRPGRGDHDRSGPHMRWDTCVLDSGHVGEGPYQTFSFGFRNAGDSPLDVSVRRVSCGCAKAELSAGRVAAGERGHLSVTVDTAGLRGERTASVTVETDDPAVPHSMVYARCNVRPSTGLSAALMDFGEVRQGDEANKVVYLYNMSGSRLAIRGVTYQIDGTGGRWDETEASVRLARANKASQAYASHEAPLRLGDYALRLGLRPNAYRPTGPFSGTMTVLTNLPPPRDRVSVELGGRIISAVLTRPAAIRLAVGTTLSGAADVVLTRDEAPIQIDSVNMVGHNAPLLLSHATAHRGPGLVQLSAVLALRPDEMNLAQAGQLSVRLQDGAEVCIPAIVLKE
jgi:hypothetical protein